MADDPHQVAHADAAPASERYDAQAEISRIYRPLASALIPPAEVRELWDRLQEVGDPLAKAGAQIIQFPGRARAEQDRGVRSLTLDPMQVQSFGGYYERPSAMGFASLRTMVQQTPVLGAVILTRVRHVNRFCSPSEDGGPGFEIRHIDRKHKLTGDEETAAKLLTRFFQHSGWNFRPRERRRLGREPLAKFMAKSIRETLTYDANPIEVEWKRDRSLGIDGFYALDGETIRLCTEEGYDGDDKITALQVVQGRITTTYGQDDLLYEVRNPQASVLAGGYGMGETELMIRVVTGFLNAMTYNIKGFDENAMPKGLLQLTGDYSSEDIAAFKRIWNAQVKGINNAWSLPVMVSKDAEGKASFERFGIEFNEMYFAKWMTFLTSIICALFGMAPDEINFESFSAQKSSLSGDDTTEKLADAKDKGLRPLLAHYESLFTDYVVAEFSEDLCFRWTGLDPRDDNRLWEGKKLVLTTDELRAELGYEPHPDKKLGTAPLNPSLIGPWMQMQQQQDQPDFGDAPDDGGDGGDAGGFDQGDEDGRDGGQDAAEAPGPDASAAAGPPAGDDFGRGKGDFGKAMPVVYSVR